MVSHIRITVVQALSLFLLISLVVFQTTSLATETIQEKQAKEPKTHYGMGYEQRMATLKNKALLKHSRQQGPLTRIQGIPRAARPYRPQRPIRPGRQ